VALHFAWQARGDTVTFLCNLQRELARGADDKDGDLAPGRHVASQQVLYGGKQEGDRLAGSGLGLHDAVGRVGRQLGKHFLLHGRHEPEDSQHACFAYGVVWVKSYSKPILSRPSSSALSSFPLSAEKGFAESPPAEVLYICLTSTPPSGLGAAFSTLGLLGCWARAVGVPGAVDAFDADPLAVLLLAGLRGCHLRFVGGGGIVSMVRLLLWCVKNGDEEMLRAVLVTAGRRVGRRRQVAERRWRERARETSFIVCYIHKCGRELPATSKINRQALIA